MTDLKPCPFCGGSNVQPIEYKAGYGTIGCGDCRFEYPDSEFDMPPLEEAALRWNTRADDEEEE